MLKEITRAEAVEMMAKQEPVFMLYELDTDHTIGDILGADGFVIDIPEGKPSKCLAEPRDKETEVKTAKNHARVPDAVFRELHAKKMTNKEIARELGYTEAAVHSRLTKLGLKRNRE